MDLHAFATSHGLSSSTLKQLTPYLSALANACIKQKPKGKALLVGLSGVQGAGKTTCSGFLAAWLQHEHQLTVEVLSIDDFYLSREQRMQLASKIHPLFATRGVPGTHDVGLMERTLDALIGGQAGVAIPYFDKALDDPVPSSQWRITQKPADVVIFEGWCVGAEAQPAHMLEQPVNTLEQRKDTTGCWRRCVNSALANEYQRIFSRVDYLIRIVAPSFDCVYNWRLEQENKLIARRGHTGFTLDECTLKQFVMHFQRISEYNNRCGSADACLYLSAERKITALSYCKERIATAGQLLFSGVEGTLNREIGADVTDKLKGLEQIGVPLILNTVKSAAEVMPLRQTLENKHPFIVENGAAVYIPQNYFPIPPRGGQRIGEYLRYAFGPSRAVLQQVIAKLSPFYGEYFDCFSALGIRGIQNVTGMSEPQAQLAQRRAFSEPLFWHGPQNELFQFKLAVENMGFRLFIDGRFVYVTRDCDKGKAMKWLCRQYASLCQRSFDVAAIGSGVLDEPMLDVADRAWVVTDAKRKPAKLAAGQGMYTVHGGLTGWCEAVCIAFSQLPASGEIQSEQVPVV